jgi:hypothetical protein
VIRVLKVYRERPTGVPFISTTARIYGQAQIDVFFAMCEATGRQPHELAGDIVAESLWEAGSQPGMHAEGRRARNLRMAQYRRYRQASAAKICRDRRPGVPSMSTRVRICGQPQIDVFFAMCEAAFRQPHELAGDIVVESLWEAGSQPGLRGEGRRARTWRLAELRRYRRAPVKAAG